MKPLNLQIHKAKEDISLTLKNLAFDEELKIDFAATAENDFFAWNQNLIADERKIILPQINLSEFFSLEDLIKQYRPASDMALCYFLFHDKKIDQKEDLSLEEQKIFDDFEKVRLLANMQNQYLGVVKNVLEKLEDDLTNGFKEDNSLLFLVLLNKFFLAKTPPKIAAKAVDLEKKLNPKILQQIADLFGKISDQKKFGAEVKKLIESLRYNQEIDNTKPDKDKSQENKAQEEPITNQENSGNKEENDFNSQDEQESKIVDEIKQNPEFEANQMPDEIKIKTEKTDFNQEKIEYKNAYKVFTSKFDEVVFPQKLVAKNELEILRYQLDLKLAKLNSISKKMSLKLKRKLLSKKNVFLEYDANRGNLDRKKLTKIVTDPLSEDIWVNSKIHEYQDTALTILLDNSGSMRGNPIVMSAMACEIIASILEKFSIKTEIIGFTTGDWKGGRARKLWESAGRPANPGRLNELRHVIYKHFNQSFKKSKVNLGLMLKEGILKENIDGEALLFARSRLINRDERRKILLVISDGTPVDDSTISVNDGEILSDHLRHVINKIENSLQQNSKIEIVGIGIGHTTDDFYRNSIVIKNLEELGDVMIEKIVNLI